MRYTHQWHRDGECSEEHCLAGHLGSVSPRITQLAKGKLSKLTEFEMQLLVQEIAAVAEASYRRGFQQGVVSQSEEGPWSRPPSEMEVASFRFNVPLEFSPPPPGYYSNGDDFNPEDLARRERGSLFSSMGRLRLEAKNASPLVDHLCGVASFPNAYIGRIWGPGDESDRLEFLLDDGE